MTEWFSWLTWEHCPGATFLVIDWWYIVDRGNDMQSKVLILDRTRKILHRYLGKSRFRYCTISAYIGQQHTMQTISKL